MARRNSTSVTTTGARRPTGGARPDGLAGEIGKREAFKSLEQETHLNLQRSAGELAAPFERLFKERRLSPTSYNILRILRGAGKGGRSCGEIGEQMIARLPDVTRLIDRLQRRGLVKRQRSAEDRRVVVVSITAKGLNAIEGLDGRLVRLHEQQFEHLTRTELTELNRLLYKARHPEGT